MVGIAKALKTRSNLYTVRSTEPFYLQEKSNMRDVSFSFPMQYDGSGAIPVVGLAKDVVVAVHSSNSVKTLWYHVGSVTGNLIKFGASRKYDDGITPAIAMNANHTVVEVHETDSGASNSLWYHVGQADSGNKSISFGSSYKYDTGKKPKIAINSNNVTVEVHEAPATAALWYNVGIVDSISKRISFGSSKKYDNGATPSIAMQDNLVVEVHQSEGANTKLWYRVGLVNTNTKTIDFGASYFYDEGRYPTIALTDDGYVLEAHTSQASFNLWKRVGQVDVANRTINWIGESVSTLDGTQPSVAISGSMAVQVYQLRESLNVVASQFIDRANWMSHNRKLLFGKKLMDIAMPASHDAGMSLVQRCILGNECNTKTQTLSIFNQLQMGSRYFDLRPVLDRGVLYTGHFSVLNPLSVVGCNGQTLDDVLNDVKSYLVHGRDLVILKFSHYISVTNFGGNFDHFQKRRLCEKVVNVLGPHLYNQPVPLGGLQSVLIDSFIGSGGKVLAVFEDLPFDLQSSDNGLYSYVDNYVGSVGDLRVYDKYSDSNDLETMRSDQISKLNDPSNHGNNLFVLSWTLTQSTAQSIGCVESHSILTLANDANSKLWEYLVLAYQTGSITAEKMVNLVYTDNHQGLQTDFAIWLNQQILRS